MATQTATKEWSQKSLGEVCSFVYGKGLSEKDRVVGDVPVYGSNGVVGFHNKALVQSSGIVVGRKGSAGSVHFSAVPFYPIDTTFYISQDDTNADLEFLFYLLKEIDLKKLKADVGVPGINREMAYREIVYLPESIKEQKAIAQTLLTVQNALVEQEKIIAKLKKLKRSMMQHLFTHGTKGEEKKTTEIGEVPKGWDVLPLGRIIAELDAGVSVKSQDRPARDGEMGVLKTSCITLGVFDADENKLVVGTQIKRLDTPLKSDVILISRMNTPALVGATAYVEEGNENLFLPDRLWQVSISDHTAYSTRWLSYQLQILWKSGVFSQIAAGTSASMKNITKGKLLSISVAVPSFPEQNKIAQSLISVDQKIKMVQKKHSVYQNLFKTLLHELISGERRINI